MNQESTEMEYGPVSRINVVTQIETGEFIRRMLRYKGNAGLARAVLSDFFNMLKANPEEMRAFSVDPVQMAVFMKFLHAHGIDDNNSLLMHTILVHLSEIDAKGDRKGLRNMIYCTFIVQEWKAYSKMVDEMLDRGHSQTFRKACRLYSLLSLVHEIRRCSLPPEFLSFVSKRAQQLVRGLTIFPDEETLGYTLECLWSMISSFDGSQKAVIQNNGGVVLLDVARNNLEHGELVELCLKILSPLTAMLIKSHHYLYEKQDGIYEVVMECVLAHMENHYIVEAGCSLLRRALIGRPADAQNMLMEDMKDILLVVKSYHTDSPDIEVNVSQLEYLLRGMKSTTGSHDGMSPSSEPNGAHIRGRSNAFWDADGKIVRTRHARSSDRPPAAKLYSNAYEQAIQRSNRGL